MSDRDRGRDKVSLDESEPKRKSGGRRRRGGRSARRSTGTYKQRIEERLFGKKGEAAKQRMTERLRQSQGTQNFTRIYREYVRGHGMPEDVPTLMLLLELEEEGEALKVIEALGSAVERAPSEQRSVLKSRLRNLEMSTSSDALADAASALRERL